MYGTSPASAQGLLLLLPLALAAAPLPCRSACSALHAAKGFSTATWSTGCSSAACAAVAAEAATRRVAHV